MKRVMGPYKTLLPVLTEKECDSCGKKIRFERMFYAFTPPIINYTYVKRYLCENCATFKEDAYKYFYEGQSWKPKRPKFPMKGDR